MAAVVAALASAGAAATALAQDGAPFEFRPASAATTARRAAADRLAATVNATIDGVRGSGTWGVMVVSLTSGDTIFDRNADAMLAPASTMKLFTSALALEHFGPDGRFETQLLHTGTVTGGVLYGDLILRGAGDPTLSGISPSRGEPSSIMRLAGAVADAGITRVMGNIVGDASGFDDAKVPEGWLKRYLHASYAARVSALSFNENKVVVVIAPTARGVAVQFSPAISGVPITSTVRVQPESRGARITVLQDTAAGQVRVSGWIGASSPARYYALVVENPELFAAGALKAALATVGVAVEGQLRVTPPAQPAAPVATLQSPTIEELVSRMNGESNNHFAELLFRNVARMSGENGSAAMANSLLGQFLADRVHADSSTVFATDGSGLSTLDRVTSRAMVQLLGYARSAPWGATLERSLPIAGKTETLARRMRRTSASGNLHAKTGTTDVIASLAGYVTADNGEDLAFSIIYNGRNRGTARDAIDKIGVALASFSR